jgi:hypothetical protein
LELTFMSSTIGGDGGCAPLLIDVGCAHSSESRFATHLKFDVGSGAADPLVSNSEYI